ncbi:MAG: S4 domain-containing protein, partial [Coraliomargarita sp.]
MEKDCGDAARDCNTREGRHGAGMSEKKARIDELLVAQGLAESRAQAKALVLAGKVRLGTERLDKPGRTLPEGAVLTVLQPPRFVSRGGEKLEGFLDRFKIVVAGLVVLDVGASTGGFT